MRASRTSGSVGGRVGNHRLYPAADCLQRPLVPRFRFRQRLRRSVTAHAYGPLLNRGLAYVQVGKLDEAIADLTHAHALAPAFWSAYRHRGLVYAMRGDHAASFQDYLKTRELAGDQ